MSLRLAGRDGVALRLADPFLANLPAIIRRARFDGWRRIAIRGCHFKVTVHPLGRRCRLSIRLRFHCGDGPRTPGYEDEV
jgi:hypothetical protein